ncbi:conserved hypothetical protein [groundwater metagenome]|uniref:Uncharacterized protein n=1 Tax=groundwater metagenome TaxID=717931 RepID=A0A098EDE1_9ZZZZ
MENLTMNNVYALLQKIDYRLKTIEQDIHELKEEPELRPEYVEKAKRIMKQKPNTYWDR